MPGVGPLHLSTSAPDRLSRAVRSLRLVIVNGLDYTGVDGLLELLAGEQLSSECAFWVEWIQALQRSELDPGSAVTAQWDTIRRARTASPETLRALLWDAAMNAWTLGDADAGLRAAREYAELEATHAGGGRRTALDRDGAAGGSATSRRGMSSRPLASGGWPSTRRDPSILCHSRSTAS